MMDAQKLKENPLSLSQMCEKKLQSYFATLDGQPPCTNLYDEIIQEIEKPLLLLTLEYCKGNKMKASEILGINRNTLSKKLKQHNIHVTSTSPLTLIR